MTDITDDIRVWLELHMLQDRYIGHLDNDRLERWPELFTEDCLYEIVPKENADMGLPIGIVHCTNRRMLRDRVVSLRHANIYEAHTYRHMTSGLAIVGARDGEIETESSYVVVQTRSDGESSVYQAGKYYDTVVRTAEGLRYRKKRVIYDTSRVQTLLATPI
ncbi:anthranilate 1,2-dioxygenase small subunit AndAd [Burkholderia oklahomensis]|uniref:anthranilate 1,2-dioxygenase small subunit AndAd n=1 Tax=Burkholderia oklahomensis TaxID=342113 RepID=UPI00016A9B7E|nr:anthranilate 1,2-dioxygenase small subunit AndAd [Burkholderia oklahomensis]AJX35459.1 aromatic-ring-hydroxylating dioxygenase, beta subunit [Burkholderia oklahomensis C6786]AOI48245.1 anthranilate 1,2-dioxygenase [Burkholderia oklahomensis C6786]KUY52613.1 anthranilate 1,2-dioxygenase [Burkholderia oklahomensis C6786]MBI0363613.1 aromatic-ring-hydroxylating dioxygenase subunit beta [Burkholderia oklahomensis]SUY27736.1 Anthranilate 1,2-dioxygenase small subunit [Burkholderia oklahomensis]